MIAEFSIELLSILLCVSILAGFIDTLAGGGGLITMPVLLISGIPPLAALGTNKLQGSVGTATSTLMMFRHKRVRWNDVKYLMLIAFIGSASGSIAVQFINVKVLSFVIPAVLLLIAGYFIFAPMMKITRTGPRISEQKFRYAIIPAIGWYDGMFGPGTGSFFSLAGVALKGQNLIDATAIAKALNFSTNIASLFIFITLGKVVWAAGLIMMLGQMTGAWLGSHCLLKISPLYLRALVVTMCLAMLVRYAISMNWI